MLLSHDALKFAKPFECVRVKMNVGIRPVCSPAQCLQLIIIRQRHTHDPLTTHGRTSGWLRDVEAVSEVGFGLVVIDLSGGDLEGAPSRVQAAASSHRLASNDCRPRSGIRSANHVFAGLLWEQNHLWRDPFSREQLVRGHC